MTRFVSMGLAGSRFSTAGDVLFYDTDVLTSDLLGLVKFWVSYRYETSPHGLLSEYNRYRALELWNSVRTAVFFHGRLHDESRLMSGEPHLGRLGMMFKESVYEIGSITGVVDESLLIGTSSLGRRKVLWLRIPSVSNMVAPHYNFSYSWSLNDLDGTVEAVGNVYTLMAMHAILP
jgi:hypothetical protein